jgi:hypothetical protein
MTTAALQTKTLILAQTGDGRSATHLRGTVLASSLAILRQRGREQAYFRALPCELHESIHALVAQAWLSMELATAHFCAMDRVFPDPQEQRANGITAAERTQNGYVATVLRSLRAAGADYVPMALERVPSVLERMVRGGNCLVYRTGLKDARIELVGYPFLAPRYCHNAWHGMFDSSLSLISRRIFVRNDLAFATGDRMALNLSWV